MEENEFSETVREICRIILKSKQKMIREQDIRILSKDFDFEEIIQAVYVSLKDVGFELISTQFLEQKYYVLTSEGKDDEITPSQYGCLALIVALGKELDDYLKLEELKEIFKDVWNADIEFLMENDYLRKIRVEGIEIIKVTPLGKAVMKNIILDLNLNSLLEVFQEKKTEN